MSLFKDIEERIVRLRNGGSRFSTERMRNFAERIGNPQNSFQAIHIAGTNGKGSTAAMLEAVLRKSGYGCGLFTSPHLLRINERIQFNRKEISDSSFVRIFLRLEEEAKKIAKENHEFAPTFFEYIAALAFCYFKEKRTDWAMVETGLGGRLDATNIVSPQISIITSIGLDHTQYLGTTLAQIAAEKAGIIKEGVPVICGIMPDEAAAVIERTAHSKSATLYKVSDFFGTNPEVETSLAGEYQKKNAATALLALKVLRETGLANIGEAFALEALKDVNWDARWQTIELADGRIVLDCSHNHEGACELEKNLKALAETHDEKPIVAVGVLGRERAIPLLESISKYAKKILFLEANEERALSFEELADCLPENHPEFENTTLEELFPKKDACSLIPESAPLVCTGSCHLAGEILARLKSENKDALSDKL